MNKPTIYESPWEATLEYSGRPTRERPVEMSICIVATPEMPTRRRVSVEEFEADMAKVRAAKAHTNGE